MNRLLRMTGMYLCERWDLKGIRLYCRSDDTNWSPPSFFAVMTHTDLITHSGRGKRSRAMPPVTPVISFFLTVLLLFMMLVNRDEVWPGRR